MADMNVSVILFTYTDTSLELMEMEVPTMENIRVKLTEVTQIVYDWATNIVEIKLRQYSQDLTCMIKVVEGTQNVIEIIILLNGIPLSELPEEYVKEFDLGMPVLIETLYDVLELNFTINISATRYVASDITKSLENKMPGNSAEISLPSDIGWYRVVSSNVNIGNCLATFYLNGTGTNYTDAIIFSGTISYGSAALLQQLAYSHNNIGITQVRLVYNSVSSGNFAYIDIYKSVVGVQTLVINAVDSTGWNLLDGTAEIATIPSGYVFDYITLVEGGIISTGLKGLRASIDELNYSQNLEGNIQTQLDGKAPTSHTSDTDKYGLASDTLYGHTKASSTIPIVASSETGSVGSETSTFARGDHVHPIQIDIPGTAEKANKLSTARGITLTGAATSSKMMFDGSADIELPVNTLDATKLEGMVPIGSIPKGALERLVIVANDEERFALTSEDVQKGDTVKVVSTNKMYFVVDTSQLYSEAGYEIYTAGRASEVPWSGITDKPTEFNPTSHASASTTYGIATDTLYGHAMASTTTPKAHASTAKVGSELEYARGDHVHPLQTYVDRAGIANYVNWSNIGNKPLYYTHFAICESDADAVSKTITLSEFSLTIGVEFTVRFKYTNTAENPVLCINENTGIPMYYNDTILSNIQAGQVYTFYYYAYTEIDPETEEETYIEKFIAKNVDWDNISNKPTTYNPTSHASSTDVYGLSTDELYGHAKASSTTPLIASETPSIGLETDSFARGDHVHPVQINVSGNAGTATKLQNARTIGISGGATGTATSFNGSSNITIPVTALDPTKLSSAVAIGKGGTGATTAAGALTNLGLTATATELNYCDGVTSAIQTQIDSKEPKFSKGTAFNKNFETNNSQIKLAGTASVGSSATIAHADHVHPAQTSVSGNAATATKLQTARTISLSNSVTSTATEFDGSKNITIPITSLDATKLSGMVPLTSIPPSAIPRLTIVADDTARFALTTDDVQNGDTVKVNSTGKMYFVVDDTKLSSEAGYEIYTAGGASSVPWAGITDKPSSFNPTSHASTATTYGASSASNYGHAMASSTTPIVAGTAAVGSETAKFARGDHVHPAQTSVSGNAGTATKLQNARTIGISGGATGTATSFNGSSNITIPVTALDPTKLSSAVAIGKGGTGATTAAGALTNLGLTATATELNYCDGVTSAIQTQINGKVAISQGTTVAGKFLSVGSDGNVTTVDAPSSVTHGVEDPTSTANVGDLYLKYPVSYVEISTPSELLAFSNRVNAGESTLNGLLTADLDMSTMSSWVAIGTGNNRFKGVFNGNGHTISNLTYTSSGGFGLFGYVEDGTIVNLNLDTFAITSENMWGGILLTFLLGSTKVQNCSIVDSSLTGEHLSVGGLVANSMEDNSCIKNCYVYNSSITGKYSSDYYGFVDGGTDDTTFISDCGLYGGNVSGNWYSSYVSSHPTVTNSYNSNDVTSAIFHTQGFWDGTGVDGTVYLNWNFIDIWNWDSESTLPVLAVHTSDAAKVTELFAYNNTEWKNLSHPTILNGTDVPTTDMGRNGDVYIKYTE